MPAPPGAGTTDPPPRLPTGLDGLDEWLDGGFAAGSLVALLADPDSQSEALCYPPAAANPSRYLTALRPGPEVEDHAARLGYDLDARETDGARLLDDPAGSLSRLDPESTVVVDPATELEREGRERYRAFLETLKRAARSTESVALLHCLRMDPRALQRDLTLARADTVLELERYADERGHAVPVLRVRKSRFGPAPTAPIRLSFEDGPIVVGPGDVGTPEDTGASDGSDAGADPE
jgi:KaiC/GvpD/RAD55 family RecA-like ATPase